MMKFELTNEERKYLGLKPVESHWEKHSLNEENFIYFEENRIVKKITVSETQYIECELNEDTQNREFLLPKTKKGKLKKLNYTSVNARNGIGTYFNVQTSDGIGGSFLWIGNFTTQKTFYETRFEQIEFASFEQIRAWIKKWIEESTEEDLKSLQEFGNEKRKNVKYKAGDFFCFKIDRRHYGFGRLLFDAFKFAKKKPLRYRGFHLMGRPLVIKIYHIISPTKDFDLQKLKNIKAFPSQFILDNHLFYGEDEVIGHLPLEEFEMEFPISHSHIGEDAYFHWGLIYKEIKDYKIKKNNYRNAGIGYNIDLTKKIMEECINSNSNDYFWKSNHIYTIKEDLRNPKNSEDMKRIFKDFGLKYGLGYSQNYKNYLEIEK